MTTRIRRMAGVAIAGALILAGSAVHAAEVRVLSSVAVKALLDELAPEFARSTTHTITPVFGIAAAIKTSIEAGEPFDVAILTPALLDELAAKGVLGPDPRPVIARSGLGIMVKSGAPRPDVSSVDAFRRAMLAARAVAYVPTGASGVAFLATLEKLGIADAVKAKARPVATGDEVNTSITSGTADLAILPVSEILPVRGAELGGVFPPDIQSYIVMAGSVNPKSPRLAAARAFIDFLMAPATTAVIRAKGMERQP